ncbi:MAG: hypothetical protein KAX49_12570 [Halanaerobiales bacterium]|nr:hypothetical protein [Halanaerobiales bacterium]
MANNRLSKKREREDVYQLFITGLMPSMSSKTKISRVESTKICKCDKKGHSLEGIPVYNRVTIHDIKDFNKS